jgi:ABC-type molybdate transport system ATPase subunit
MEPLYGDSKEQALHLRAIERLARKIDLPVALVKSVYEDEYAHLKDEARVMNFVAVFANRRARDILLRKPA